MNLKTIILLSSILLGAIPQLRAQDDMGLEPNQAVIGHTLTNKIDDDDNCFGEAGKYTLGARLTADQLAPYKGCEIVGLRFAVGVPQSRTRVFINRVEGSNIYDAVAKNVNAVAGWNNVTFPEKITIKEGDSYFYGFDYSETAEMAAAEKGGICSVMTSSSNGALMLLNNTLYPLSDVGSLCVQLIVDVTNLTPHNMNLGFVDTGFKYKSIADPFSMFANINNNGRDTINKFKIGWAFDDYEPEYLEINATVNPGDYYAVEKNLKFPKDFQVGIHSFRIFIDSIEDAPVPDDGIKEVTVSYGVYNFYDVRKKVYLEAYMDPETPLTAMLNEIITTYPDRDNLACFVNVYPAGSDLECNISQVLHDRYAFTYPCFSTNRTQFPGENTVAYDFNDYLTLFPTDFFHFLLEDIIFNDVLTPSFANMELDGDFDAGTRTLTINTTITPRTTEVAEIFGNLALNLLVVEDKVKAPQMVINRLGSATLSKNYENPNVLRHACYGVDGMKVENTLEPITIESKIQFPEDWNEENVRIVALLTPWHEADEKVSLRDLDIINCDEVNVKDFTNSISEISVEDDETAEYFTITGLRTEPSEPGIYLKRTAKGCRKILIK